MFQIASGGKAPRAEIAGRRRVRGRYKGSASYQEADGAARRRRTRSLAVETWKI